MKEVAGLAVVGVALALVIFGWPVILWVAGSAIAAAWLRAEARRLTGQSRVWARVASGARDMAYCVTAGLCLVLMAQVLLRLFSKVVSDGAVGRCETFLIGTRDLLTSLTSIGLAATTGMVLICLVVAHAHPSWTPVKRLAKYRKGLSYGWLILATCTSFTFFSGTRVIHLEGSWVEANRMNYVAALRELDHHVGRLVAIAAIEEKAEAITPDERRAILEILGNASAESSRDAQFQVFSKQLNQEYPRPQRVTSEAQQLTGTSADQFRVVPKLLRVQEAHVGRARLTEERYMDIRQWSTSVSFSGAQSRASSDVTTHSAKETLPPRKKELQHIRAEVAQIKQLADERQEALTQVMTAAVGSSLPRASIDLIRGLVDNIVGELVSGVIEELGVRNVLADFVKSRGPQATARKSPTSTWRWPAKVDAVARTSPVYAASNSESHESRSVSTSTTSSESQSRSTPSSGHSSSALTGVDLNYPKLEDFRPFGLKPSGFDLGAKPGTFKPGDFKPVAPTGPNRSPLNTGLNGVRRPLGPTYGQPPRPTQRMPIRRGPRR
jgi:hypothetical protein